MSDLTLFLTVFLAVDFATLFLLLIFHLSKEAKHKKVLRYGEKAEKEVAEYLKRNFPKSLLINNLYLEKGNAVTQIDHILLCPFGVFVIETKSHNGTRRTGGREWVQLWGEKVVHFHSPILQNKIHCRIVESILNAKRRKPLPVYGLVVFTSRKVSFTKRPEGILRLSELAATIRKYGRGKRETFSRQTLFTMKKQILSHSVRKKSLITRHRKRVRSRDRNGSL